MTKRVNATGRFFSAAIFAVLSIALSLNAARAEAPVDVVVKKPGNSEILNELNKTNAAPFTLTSTNSSPTNSPLSVTNSASINTNSATALTNAPAATNVLSNVSTNFSVPATNVPAGTNNAPTLTTNAPTSLLSSTTTTNSSWMTNLTAEPVASTPVEFNPLDLLRRTQILQTPALLFNFKFDRFTTSWFLNEKDYKAFYKKHSRITGDAPPLPVQWKSESVLAVFWPSIDDIIRLPAYQSTEVIHSDNGTQLRLTYYLNKPCVGIITDTSPMQFIVFDHATADVDSVVIRTEKTRSTNCF